jgi:hypothetical protein
LRHALAHWQALSAKRSSSFYQRINSPGNSPHQILKWFLCCVSGHLDVAIRWISITTSVAEHPLPRLLDLGTVALFDHGRDKILLLESNVKKNDTGTLAHPLIIATKQTLCAIFELAGVQAPLRGP